MGENSISPLYVFTQQPLEMEFFHSVFCIDTEFLLDFSRCNFGFDVFHFGLTILQFWIQSAQQIAKLIRVNLL